MKKQHLLRILTFLGLPLAGYLMGKRTAHQGGSKVDAVVPSLAGQEAGATGSGADSSPKRAADQGKLGEKTAASGIPQVFSGSADEFLLKLVREPGHFETQYLMFRSVEEASPEQLVSWAKDLAEMPATRTWQQQALQLTAKRWGELDPKAALAWASGLSGSSGSRAMEGILSGVATNDPDKAISLAKALPSGAKRDGALVAVGDVLRITNPAAALALVKGVTGYQAASCVRESLAALALQDPLAAAKAAEGYPASHESSALAGVYSSWASQDPKAALDHASKLKSPEKRILAIESTISAWAEREPEAALDYCLALPAKERAAGLEGLASSLASLGEEECQTYIKKIPEGKERNSFITNMIDHLSSTDTMAALKLLTQLEPHMQSQAMDNNSFMHYVGQVNPEKCFELLKDSPGRNTDQYLGVALATMAENDPARAATLAASLTPLQQSAALPPYLAALARTDGPGAVAQAQGIRNTHGKTNALAQVFSAWAEENTDSLLAWSATASPEDRRQAQASVIGYKINTDIETAKAMADTLLKSGVPEDQNAVGGYLHSISAHLAEESPLSAMQWAAELPMPEMREQQTSYITGQWAVADPAAASSWVQGLPAGEAKDGAITALVNAIQEGDPASAAVWASSISTATTREITVTEVYRQWITQDRDAAEAALGNAPLSQDMKASLLKESTE